MSEDIEQAAAMREAFDTIEEAYEFMLAYAAQGRKRETEEGAGESQIRQYLKRLSAALDALETAARPGFGEAGGDFAARFLSDIGVMRSVVGLLLAQPSITSDMVDNTNALVAVRAFLTDIFFIDQAVLPPR
ncbi:MAG TPA: hypothetical protein VK862_16810 [Afifellaceae bacterium]|nr:hypothetical protein [Afifellaceae bacterium]